ncbi:MAG: polysaccharide deacetylase family protein [Acidimicrobiia bacterium]|nr:polysaccharide deacetylase family protein [Acidimicrobiia bacterium]
MSTMTVSVHDVAPCTAAATERWVDALDRRGVCATLLVVPGPWSLPMLADHEPFCAWLRDAAVHHEVALHGWTHRAAGGGGLARRAIGAVVARGAAEFWSLDREEARRRLRLGLAELARAGFSPCGFTPPGWLASPETFQAARDVGLRYTTSHVAVTDLVTGRLLRAPVVSHRAGGLGQGAGAALFAQLTARRARHGRPVRIALHPSDVDQPRLRDVALRAIDAALDAGARPLTYRVWISNGGLDLGRTERWSDEP